LSAESEMIDGPEFENSPPRLELTATADLDDAQRAVYEAITGGPRASQKRLVPLTDAAGRLAGPFAVMLLSPEIGHAVQAVGAKVRFTSALTDRERELAILTVAGRLRSDFERLAHEPAARQAGLSRAQLHTVLAGRVPDGLSADEALICRLAQVMTADRNLPDQDYDQGLETLGAERLAALTWLVGYYSALALALAVFRPEVPEAMWAAYRDATA
jgi:4-carboxymuconolactone decarboxylase